MQNIIKISGYIKWLLLLLTSVVICYLGQQLFIEGQIRYYSDPAFYSLWQSGSVSKVILGLITTPLLALLLLSAYFTIRALSLFQQGVFYSPLNFVCYFGFLLSKVTLIVYEVIILFVFSYLNRAEDEQVVIELKLEFGELTTLLFMLVVIYLLKAAKEVDEENKEFI